MKSIALSILTLAALGGPALADTFSDEILRVHNRERAEVGVAPLRWNTALAQEAQTWANYLAQTDRFEHAGNDKNPYHGENLWKGSRGAYGYAQMAQGWADEKRYFKFGTFPNISTSGNWADAGHYTQMIWQGTTEIGCAIGSNGSWDILVCRYNPPGNYVGQKPY